MSAGPALVRRWHVGSYTCTLTCPKPKAARQGPLGVSIEWSPHVPQSLTAEEKAEYREGRDQALASVAQILGVRAAVVEI